MCTRGTGATRRSGTSVRTSKSGASAAGSSGRIERYAHSRFGHGSVRTDPCDVRPCFTGERPVVFVHKVVMLPTEHDQVLERRRPAQRHRHDVVTFGERGQLAAREAADPV